MDFLSRQTGIIWTSPQGTAFNLKTKDGEGGYKRKHVGEVKTSPNDTKKGQKSTTKKITESSDTFTDSGVSGKDITLQCLFIGDSHDIEAETFCEALCEVGKSRLKLAYGEEFTVNVIDFSSKYSTTEKINSTVVTVNFHQTAKTTYPKSSTSDVKSVQNAAAITDGAVAENLAAAVATATTPSLIESINANFSNVLSKVSNALDTVNNVSLNSIMSDLAGQELTSNACTMVSQLQRVMQKATVTVSKVKNLTQFASSSSFGSLARTWANLINELFSANSTKASKLNREQIINLVMTDTTVQSAISAIAAASVEYGFETRKEAINAATSLVELDEMWTEFINEQSDKIENLEDIFICDSGLSELVNAAAGAIIDKSFGLKVERTVILAEDETIINLAYKYYPDDFELNPEETVKHLIDTNELSDEEFFILRKGTELKIYV